MASERIEGEFHYAEPMSQHNPEDPHSSCLWNIFPHGETQAVAGYVLDKNVAVKIAQLDNCARHFIQQGRQAALAEVDAAARKFGVFSAEHDENTGFCQVIDTDGVNSGSGYGFTAALLTDGEAKSDGD